MNNNQQHMDLVPAGGPNGSGSAPSSQYYSGIECSSFWWLGFKMTIRLRTRSVYFLLTVLFHQLGIPRDVAGIITRMWRACYTQCNHFIQRCVCCNVCFCRLCEGYNATIPGSSAHALCNRRRRSARLRHRRATDEAYGWGREWSYAYDPSDWDTS